MTDLWSAFVNALGATEDEVRFSSLLSRFGEIPNVSMDPEEYNDPVRRTTYYKLKSSGIEIGFRQKRLTHLHLFCSPEEGYAPYGGPLLAGIKKSWTEAWVVKSLGNPSRSGGGNLKGLLGFIHRWIRYDFAAHAVRFEFFSDGSLRKVSLMTLPQ